jgi:RNA polymerase sigma-70 factor (ECF subfamily)
MDTDSLVDHLFRRHSAKIVATLTRVFGSRHLDLAEDVVQDALLKALQQWPFKGIPENPAAWLTLVARNRALDLLRRDASLASKAEEIERALPGSRLFTLPSNEMDDQLALILMCCHPALPVEYQIALTLKTACGFSTAEIARAFLTPQPTIAQRLVRAKRQIRDHDIVIDPPSLDDLPARIDSVLRVIYLLFNEGYAATSGDDLVRSDLCEEAIRLGTLLVDQAPLKLPPAHALLALMMLQAARLPARTREDGSLALLSEQNRDLWDRKLISLGMRHFGESATGDKITTYHLQAEIAAIHAASNSNTDWPRLVELYNELYKLEPTPIVLLNRAIAISRADGPHAGLAALEQIDAHHALRNYHLLPAVAAELWKQVGDRERAAQSYQRALACPCSVPERTFLETQLQRLV